jgi:hypothetical protein
MAILSKGTTYADGDQITSTNLNALVDSATFASGAVESGGGIQLNGSGQLKVAGNIDIGTSNLTATGTISLGTTSFNDNNITNVGSIALDTITNDGTDITIDSSGDINLDAGGQDIRFKDDGTQFGRIAQSSSNLVVASSVSDKDILFQGSDSGSTITALTLDMSAAGAATFNDKITAVGTSVFTNLDISGDVTVDTTTLKVDSSNNRVGIATASPAVPLDVNGSARVVGTFFVGTDDTDPSGLLEVYGGGTGQNEGGEIRLRTAADFDSTYDHYFIDAYQDDLRMGRSGSADFVLNSSGNVGIGTTSPDALFQVRKDGTNVVLAKFQSNVGTAGARDFQVKTPTSDSASEPFRFTTNNSFSFEIDDAEKLRIGDTGNVGIGTNNPSYLLDVSPTSNGGEIARFKSDTTNAAADVLIVDQDNSNTRAALQVQGNAGSTECLFVGSNGNVGIGTSDPDYLLDINDDAASGVGIRVTGGGGGSPLAQFVRDVSSSGSVSINIAGGDPQFQLTSSGSDVMAIGLDGSENTFQVCAGSSVGSNQVLVVGTNGKVGIGETVPSAPLTVTSTTGGVLLPRMTTSDRTSISSPSNGEMVYDTSLNKFYGYANGAWVALH